MNPATNYHSRIAPMDLGGRALIRTVNDNSQLSADLPDIEYFLAEERLATEKKAKRQFVRTRRFIRGMSFTLMGMFALIGLAFTGVFIAMQYHWLDVKGSSVSRNEFFKTVPKAPVLATKVTRSAPAISCVRFMSNDSQVPICAWNSSEEYATIRGGLDKDKDVINKVSKQTGVSARLIAASVVPEQLRWFTDDREYYKQMFEPLKILGTAANMTYGIGGFHPDTARRVEQYAVDTNSPFYAGDGMASLVKYPSAENPRDNSTLARLSDSKDHYYSYLYVALFIKEITNQWQRTGYDISNRPDVIVTLFNIGFGKSVPKTNPQIGGATITVNGTKYSYGELGTDFYNSDELTAIFPMKY